MIAKTCTLIALLSLVMTACSSNSSPSPQPPGFTLNGTVYAPTGQSVEGTFVVACLVVNETCDEAKSREVEVTTSGASAPFSIGDLSKEAYELSAVKDANGNNTYGDAGDYYAQLESVVTPPAQGLELHLQVVDEGNNPGEPPNIPGEPGTPVQTSRFFLPTGGQVYNTTDVTVETDAAGGIHMVYPSLFGSDAFYAYCVTNCTAPDKASVVIFKTDGTVYNTMLALTKSGKPRVLLSAYHKIYYASCDSDCTRESSWTQSVILEHTGDREVSGEAFALDSQGRPRFIMHAYRAYLGIGQPDPATFYVACDADCGSASSWQVNKIADQIWQESQLRFNAQAQARLATVAVVAGGNGTEEFAAYLECNTGCTGEAGWVPMTLTKAYSDRYTNRIEPAISMALTQAGAPRIFFLASNDEGEPALLYAYCDTDCTGDNWGAISLGGGDRIRAGLDLALDLQDRPRVVYNYFGSIVMAYCDTACDNPSTEWATQIVENANDIPADQIPYPNCSYGVWSLRHPSLSIAPDGLPRIGYQAEDISAGNDPRCPAGVDLTLSRYTQLARYE